ncbi:maleylpyruvate isomerase family mycothiol-dependent enzyme [Actinoplanes sp. TFC3]|uniref:maleylpyruvate isomerase family mycothiol-dependent enzyme n=1 Tax=Actinoplanes sp. TFC3 TaxID=1710355 RepID=UPI0009E8C9B3|nr:maleylpyruvate isomerase family mycothiol-dependent enzyme [Actinoplanes sp. TFC3]
MSDDELIHRRMLRAPRELVWHCLTRPQELARFWGPRGMITPVEGIVVELRAGGRFETLMIGEHGSHRMLATFTEVAAPERLAWLEPASGLHTAATLTDLGAGGTELVIHQRHVPEAMRTPQARAGFATSLDKLEEYLMQALVAPTYERLAAIVAPAWQAPTLCEKWAVRHLVAHVTMPARLSTQQFGAEMAAARGDFAVLADTLAARDAALPVEDLLAQLRSPVLHAWQPPGGAAAGALSHAVIHSLDVTVALGRDPVAPPQAVQAVLEQLVAAEGAWFGVDLSGARLQASDTGWGWGDGRLVHGHSGELVALLAGRALPDGRVLPRR